MLWGLAEWVTDELENSEGRGMESIRIALWILTVLNLGSRTGFSRWRWGGNKHLAGLLALLVRGFCTQG